MVWPPGWATLLLLPLGLRPGGGGASARMQVVPKGT
jgi:hypothetical protein